ncbi:hypothetical protein [Amycolatopsis dendrobii]|uniref:Uncharacterized protein n=1 Tax=Amycolatopsis dendrobii TaxID=2760662 RepID=A0A7W3W609_9PSEU|nr:hypothetical protein [Amycolatopsis dendrobii]MBB1159378.1 hypothetical protein [Amycolatopsis dendrobii]
MSVSEPGGSGREKQHVSVGVSARRAVAEDGLRGAGTKVDRGWTMALA